MAPTALMRQADTKGRMMRQVELFKAMAVDRADGDLREVRVNLDTLLDDVQKTIKLIDEAKEQKDELLSEGTFNLYNIGWLADHTRKATEAYESLQKQLGVIQILNSIVKHDEPTEETEGESVKDAVDAVASNIVKQGGWTKGQREGAELALDAVLVRLGEKECSA